MRGNQNEVQSLFISPHPNLLPEGEGAIAPNSAALTPSLPLTDWYLGSSTSYHVWLIYRPELDFLKSREAALTLSLAEQIGRTYKDKPHLVFAPAKYAPNKMLLPLAVEHAPLPFALYRMEKE